MEKRDNASAATTAEAVAAVDFDPMDKTLTMVSDTFTTSAKVEYRWRLRIGDAVMRVLNYLVRTGICTVELIEDKEEVR